LTEKTTARRQFRIQPLEERVMPSHLFICFCGGQHIQQSSQASSSAQASSQSSAMSQASAQSSAFAFAQASAFASSSVTFSFNT
jgi:hypothetical protein